MSPAFTISDLREGPGWTIIERKVGKHNLGVLVRDAGAINSPP